MRAFWMNAENTVYCGNSAEQVTDLFKITTGDKPDEGFPTEISIEELATEMIKHDDAGQPTEFKTSIGKVLLNAKKPGYLCGNIL